MKETSHRQVILRAPRRVRGDAELPVPAGSRGLSLRPLWQVVPRLASYGLVILGIWLVLTVMFPPLFMRSSERAVINSPVNLVTTPVEGIVTGQAVAVGAAFVTGQPLMTLQNPNMDRSLLMDLTGKQLDSRRHYDETKSKIEGDQARLAQIAADIQRYQSATQREHAARIRGIEARLAAASQQVRQQEDVVNRNMDMQWVGAVSEAYTSASRAQLAALTSSRNAIRAELESARGSSQAARDSVYTTSIDGSVGALVQKQEELRAEIRQLQDELAQLGEYGRSVDKLVASEQARLERVSNYAIKAYSSGVVQDVLAPPGTRVAAGATLMRTTNCSAPRVVAVFPRSLSKNLLPGSKVSVQVDGVEAPVPGTVTEILPRAPEGDQARYFVPFPPIEKNEIYLIARLDSAMPGMPGASGGAGNCALGRWAKVSLDSPWWRGLI